MFDESWEWGWGWRQKGREEAMPGCADGQDRQKKVKLEHGVGPQGPLRAKRSAPYPCSEPKRKA